MRRSTLILSAALLASAAGSLWLWNRLANTRAENETLRQQLAALSREVPREPPPEAPQAADSPPSALAAPASVEPSTPVTAQTPAPPPNLPANTWTERQRRLLSNPEYRKAIRDHQRTILEATYRDLPEALGLPPEQAAALLDLMAEQSVEQRQQQLQWRQPVDKKDELAMQRDVAEMGRRHQAEQEKLLGTATMDRLTQYFETLPSRSDVNSLRTELAGGPAALRDDQYEPLLDVVIAEQLRINQEIRDYALAHPQGSPPGESFDARRTELTVAANQRIVEAARPILSQSQLAALEEMYRRQRLQMEAQSTLTRLQVEASAQDVRGAKTD